MYLINMLEYNKYNEDWKHTSTRVISTCVDNLEAKRKMKMLNNFECDNYKTEFKLQVI